MHEHSTVPVLDVRDVLRDAKTNCPVYMKTDTHWNFLGGFVAYQELIRTLVHLVPALELEPLPLADFSVTNRFQPGGDMARTLGSSMTETNYYTLTPTVELPKIIYRMPSLEHYQDPGYIGNSQAHGRLIIFHDSFAGAWFPLLPYNFNQIISRWQYELDPVLVEQNKPDVVVTEMLERFFNVQDPKKIMAKEALN